MAYANYSRLMIFPSCLAPAVIQRFALSQIALNRTRGGALLFRKMREFLSFQTVHDKSMVMNAIVLLSGACSPVIVSHHAMT